jgi:hypothetical protein
MLKFTRPWAPLLALALQQEQRLLLQASLMQVPLKFEIRQEWLLVPDWVVVHCGQLHARLESSESDKHRVHTFGFSSRRVRLEFLVRLLGRLERSFELTGIWYKLIKFCVWVE